MIEKSHLRHFDSRETTLKVEESKEESNGKILYVPLDTGIMQKQLDREIHYFGLTSTIPVQGYPFNICDHDINVADLFTVLEDKSINMIPLKNGIIERYEMQDINSYDVHVMYRVPYIRYP